MTAWLNSAPLALVGAVLTVLFLSAEELGCRLRRIVSLRRGANMPGDGESGDEGVGNLVGAALGLLALIFGFTYAMAQDRYDQRRALVMAEARAVATSYLRFQAFDEPQRSQLSSLMREYTVVRTGTFDAQTDRQALRALVTRSEAFQERIWDVVLTGLRNQPELVEPVMDSTNQMFEIAANRRAIVDARIPRSIELGLVGFGMMAAFFTGYGLALDRRHRMVVIALFVLFTSIYLLVLDLDRSYSGTIRVSQTPMIQAADRIARLEAAKGTGRLAAPSSLP